MRRQVLGVAAAGRDRAARSQRAAITTAAADATGLWIVVKRFWRFLYTEMLLRIFHIALQASTRFELFELVLVKYHSNRDTSTIIIKTILD